MASTTNAETTVDPEFGGSPPDPLKAVAAGYVEAADGDAGRALRWALEDLVETERELGATRDLLAAAHRLISAGYVRDGQRRAA